MTFLRTPFGTRCAVLLAIATAACAPDARSRVAQRTGALVETTGARQPPTRVSHVAVCDSVAVLWGQMAGVKVTRADTTLTPLSLQTPVVACHVAMDAPHGLPPGSVAKVDWADSTFRGWIALTHWDADGPDGFSRTFVRTGVQCQIDFQQDGGDDSDSTYVPKPNVAEQTACWPTPRQ